MESVFQSVGTNHSNAKFALKQVKIWQNLLSFRISLQKIIDSANKLPILPVELKDGVIVSPHDDKYVLLREEIEEMLHELKTSLVIQSSDHSMTGHLGKRKHENDRMSYDDLLEIQNCFKPRWKKVIDSTHSRANFGSNIAISKMKSFKQTVWDQV
jgi:hypothetical protein